VNDWPVAVTEGMLMMGIVMEVNKSIVVFSWHEHNSGMYLMQRVTRYLVQTKGIS